MKTFVLKKNLKFKLGTTPTTGQLGILRAKRRCQGHAIVPSMSLKEGCSRMTPCVGWMSWGCHTTPKRETVRKHPHLHRFKGHAGDGDVSPRGRTRPCGTLVLRQHTNKISYSEGYKGIRYTRQQQYLDQQQSTQICISYRNCTKQSLLAAIFSACLFCPKKINTKS